MAHIKEPEGIDFVINSGPLTDKDRKVFREAFEEYRERNRSPSKSSGTRPKKKSTRKKTKAGN